MTWHSACSQYDRPAEWTSDGRGSTELRLRATLVDWSGELDVTVFASMAARLVAPLDLLLDGDAPAFHRACAAPLFRPAEWTLRLAPSLTDETIYVSVEDCVGRAPTRPVARLQ